MHQGHMEPTWAFRFRSDQILLVFLLGCAYSNKYHGTFGLAFGEVSVSPIVFSNLGVIRPDPTKLVGIIIQLKRSPDRVVPYCSVHKHTSLPESMATAMIGAALSVVRTALSPFTDSLLEKWAASKKLGSNVKELELELLAVQALLEHTVGKEIVDNSALKKLLVKLQDLGYDAEDALDELEYFRIQDELEGTFDASDEHAKGATYNLALNVRHTAKAVGKMISLPSSCFSATTAHGTKGKAHRNSTISSEPHTNQANQEANGGKANLGKCFPCSSLPSVQDNDDDNSPQRNHTDDEPPKLSFDRVDASTRMQHIVEQLRLVRGIVSSTITTLGPSCITVPNIAQSRPVTTSESIDTKLYGRDTLKEKIISQITGDKYSGKVLTVIPIVGLGGMGKTTLAQHIYRSEKVQKHFEVKVWTCVSLNFNVNRVLQEIETQIPKVEGESGTTGDLIGKRLKNKKFLVVLDDIWDCSNEDEWKRLRAPFKMSQVLGNIIIVTTRFPAQAEMVTTVDPPIDLKGLDHQTLKDLFMYFVFGVDQSSEDKTLFTGTGERIVSKLKGSPLAAKTVGRILRNQRDLAFWNKVLDSKEWEQKDGINDIMPALKLSYDYLPSRLQLCFSYCALFPQDYKFQETELINFWIGLNVLHSSHGDSKRVEDTGLSNLRELVNHGFFEEKGEKGGNSCYIIHDLLHDLARQVSSHECLHVDISQSQMNFIQVWPSVRHLSIRIDDTSVNDRLTRKNCVEDFNTLYTRLKVEKLRTLMIFGEHHGCFVKALGDLFREAKALRVIFLSKASYNVECLLCNFYSLLHLRYLRIECSLQYKARFPNKISRFYHMVVVDAINCDIIDLPTDTTNLVKLRHLLVQNDRIYSSIVDVGKMKSLQELRRFMVKQEDRGFELRQIGHLIDLCELSIYNLQNVQVKVEADEAKLLVKSNLRELVLHWDNIDRSTDDSTLEEYVLERLKPSNNLLELSVKGNRGACCPSWLGTNLYIKSLKSLCLDGVRWKTFPPIGQLLLLDNVPHDELPGNIPKERFGNLKKLKLCNLTMVQKWALHYPCQLFPFLEVLIINDCPKLVELSFQHIAACCQQGKEANAIFFPRLSKLEITKCPQLLSFPPVPWSEAPCSINITGSSSLHQLVFTKENSYRYSLRIFEKKDTTDSMFWNVLAFHNLTGLKELKMYSCQPMPLCYIQMLSFLRKLEMSCTSNAFPFVEADWHAKYQFPVESLVINKWNASGKELTQLLIYFPDLSYLKLWSCEKVTKLAVNVRGHHTTETPGPSSPANKVEELLSASAEDDVIVVSEEAECGLFLLPPQLQELQIWNSPELSLLCSSPHDDSNEEDGQTGDRGGGGLQGLTSLRRLEIWSCPKLLSAYSSSSFSSSFPFPNSLQHLVIWGEVGTGAPVSLSNLTALTSLHIQDCGDLRGEGLLSLLTQGHLTKLSGKVTPNFFADSEPSEVHEQELPPRSLKLQELIIDDVAGFTAASIRRRLLFSSLTKLGIFCDNKVERFTEQQEALLFVNSLDEITFEDCDNLQSLPEPLHRLPNLKTLHIMSCKAIQVWPKDGLPSSLEEMEIEHCPEIQSLPKGCLPDSLQKLEIRNCPAIRSLPEVDDLPSLLRELYVSESESKDLRSQCRKLKNIIPIVYA